MHLNDLIRMLIYKRLENLCSLEYKYDSHRGEGYRVVGGIQMKKVTSITLVLLFLTSFLASMDLSEMKSSKDIFEASGRTTGDPTVSAIASPKETSCNDLGCRDELLAGESVKIESFIKNDGSGIIEELGYTTTIYLTDASGNPGLIAKDSTGSDLRWNNPDVICDDGTICPFDSTNGGSLAVGQFLGGGKHIMQIQGGGDIVWTPTVGEYIIDVTVYSPTDDDPGNNAYQTYVKVIDWVDVQVDLAWTPSGSEPSDSTTFRSTDFTLTVALEGSQQGAQIRDVVVLLKASGEVDNARLDAGAWIVGSDTTNDLTGQGRTVTLASSGASTTVRTWENGSNASDYMENTRNIITLGSDAEITGNVLGGNTSNQSTWILSAELVSYTIYGQFQECERVWNATGDSENVTIFQDFCEIEETTDGYARTNYDEIVGSITNVHDIRLNRVGVYQGYSSDCSGSATSFLGVGDIGSLNVGCSQLYAEVEHRGSDPSTAYTWDLAYTVSLNGVQVTSGTANTCVAVEPGSPVYQPVSGATPAAVCVQLNLAPGEWEFSLSLSLTDTKYTDMRQSNNDVTYEVRVENNKPFITSLELINEGDLIIGQADLLMMTAQAFDVDDPTGTSLTYVWSTPGGILPGCTTNECNVPIIREYVPTLAVSVVVEDEFEGAASQEIVLEIWNSQTGTATTASGVGVFYNVTYFLASTFEVTATDGSLESHQGVSNLVDMDGDDLSGTFDAVSVIEYSPSATFSSGDILSQTLNVDVPKTIGAKNMWYYDSQGRYIMFDNAPSDDDDDATIDVFTYTFDPTQGILPSGQLVFFGNEAVKLEPPSSEISGFSAAASKGGQIRINWDVTVPPNEGEEFVLSICEVSGSDCNAMNVAQPGQADRMATFGGPGVTTHGTTYHIYLAVCQASDNSVCSQEAEADVVADSRVDGGVSVTGLTINAVGEQWELKWTVSGDTSDVDAWMICSDRTNFNAANMPMESCQTTSSADVDSYSWAKPTAVGSFTYFFTVVPVDELGNIQAGDSINSIDYFREGEDVGTDNNNTIGDVDETASGVPGWTWGVIGGIVLIALVAGGFILSRGDGGGDEGKDWDY